MSSMASVPGTRSGLSIKVLIFGFIAGFLAVPLGHQVMSLAIYLIYPGRAFPWDMTANPGAFGLPRVVNLSFWGGVWGVLWALVSPLVPRGILYYVIATIFGAVAATAVGAYVVTAIKHQPPGSFSGFGLYLNGAWGLVTAIIFEQMRKRF